MMVFEFALMEAEKWEKIRGEGTLYPRGTMEWQEKSPVEETE
jgi:hypothetical protein